jgi:hypothetical protein
MSVPYVLALSLWRNPQCVPFMSVPYVLALSLWRNPQCVPSMSVPYPPVHEFL